MTFRSSLRLTLSLTLATLAAQSCTPKQNTSQKVVRLYFSDDVSGADPAAQNDVVSTEFTGHIFEGLLAFSYLGKMGELTPALAVAMPEFSNKNTTVTFKLQKGVLFQDDAAFVGGKGRELVAQDFVYSLKRLADPRLNSPNVWMVKGLIKGIDAWAEKIKTAADADKAKAFDEPVEGLQAPDAHTFVINLVRPNPQLLSVLSMPPTAAVAREVVEKYGLEIGNHPVGTGPYQLQEWIRGSKMILEKNPTYRKDFYPSAGSDQARQAGLLTSAGQALPLADVIQWDIIREEQPRWLKFLSGELDLSAIPKDNFTQAVGPDGQLTSELQKKNLKLHKSLSMTTWWIEFNLKDPILGKNLKLRQAIAHAFDREKALKILFNDRGVLSNGPILPFLEGGDALTKYPYTFNVDRAKALLKEAGFPDGKGLPNLSFDLRGPGTTSRQLAQMIQDNLKAININIDVIGNAFPEALKKQKEARYQMMLGGWAGDYPDPENYLQCFISANAAPGPNSSNFMNKDFDDLYEKVKVELPGPKRVAMIKRMVDILQAEVPVVFFYHALDYRVSQPWLQNYHPNDLLYGAAKFYNIKR
jgi:oligopeptide transport system substrate-binding protein